MAETTTMNAAAFTAQGTQRDKVALPSELFDGTEGVTLVWLGRRRIPGIEPGRTIKAQGRIAMRDGHKVLYNPYYELQTAT